MRLRTVKQAWEELHRQDPNCAIGLDYLRSAVKTGLIPTFPIGRRRVFDLDKLDQYLFSAQEPQAGKVRRVP